MDENEIDETLYKFASDSLHITGKVKVAKIWSGKKKSLIRFQVIVFIVYNWVIMAFESVPILQLIKFLNFLF